MENNLELLPSLIESKYTEKTICYSSVKGCVQYPGEFYLIPYNQRLTSIATAMYIAAFDGHRELFLLGVDGTADSTSEIENASHVASICKVLAAYSNTKFVFVSNRTVSSEFRKYSNVQSMNYREWISYCDV